MKKQHKTIIIVGASIAILGIFTTFLWLQSPFLNRWAKNQYFGEISKVTSKSVTIINKENQETYFRIDKETKILLGPREGTIDNLSIATPVIIIGDPDTQGRIRAKAIRVFPPRNSQKQP